MRGEKKLKKSPPANRKIPRRPLKKRGGEATERWRPASRKKKRRKQTEEEGADLNCIGSARLPTPVGMQGGTPQRV